MVVAHYRNDTLMASSSIDNIKSIHHFNNITTTTNYTNTPGQVGAKGFKRVDITVEEEGKWNLVGEWESDTHVIRPEIREPTMGTHVKTRRQHVEIYDARCDGLHYKIAIEKCSMNLDEFIRRKTKDRRELLRMFSEIIRGIIHIHGNGIAHCAISPHNIVVKTYGSIQDVPKLCGWSYCTKHPVTKSEQSLQNIEELVRLVMNVSHHLDDKENKAEWSTSLVFKGFILDKFPKLFPTVFHVVQIAYNSGSPVLAEFFVGSY
ncbi:FMP32, mitochondrial-like protein [Tanacetum coccineum]